MRKKTVQLTLTLLEIQLLQHACEVAREEDSKADGELYDALRRVQEKLTKAGAPVIKGLAKPYLSPRTEREYMREHSRGWNARSVANLGYEWFAWNYENRAVPLRMWWTTDTQWEEQQKDLGLTPGEVNLRWAAMKGVK